MYKRQGLNYDHGTGHGVGYLLNVHERPNGIRFKMVPERMDNAVQMCIRDRVGVVKRGQGIQVIYGPQVTVIKSNLEAYLAQAGEGDEVDRPAETQKSEQSATDSQSEAGVSEQMPAESVQLQTSSHILYSPLKGKAAPISESPDRCV